MPSSDLNIAAGLRTFQGMKSKTQPNLFDGELMTIEQIAREFGRSTRTIMRWCATGNFAPRVKIGRNFYFRRFVAGA